MAEDRISESLKRMERRAAISLRHAKEDKDSEKAEGWKRAVEHYTCAAEALKKIQQYMAIGTVEECQEAMNRQRAKKPLRIDMCTCPTCGTYNESIKKRRNTVNQDIVYCWHCGQAMEINRSDVSD